MCVECDGCVDEGCTVTELDVGVPLNRGPLGEKGFEGRHIWDKRNSLSHFSV